MSNIPHLAGPMPSSKLTNAFAADMSEDFRASVNRVLEIEGGYANHEEDPRGSTRWGIPEGRARKHDYEGQMTDLPLRLAVRIYHLDFWTVLGGDELSGVLGRPFSFDVFEAGVHAGVDRAATWLQKSLNLLNRRGRDWSDVITDGRVGPQTIGACEALMRERPEVHGSLVKVYQGHKTKHYIEITDENPKLERFLHGWLRQRVAVPSDYERVER